MSTVSLGEQARQFPDPSCHCGECSGFSAVGMLRVHELFFGRFRYGLGAVIPSLFV